MRLRPPVLVFLATAAVCSSGVALKLAPPPNPNSFLQNNPGYRERVGAAYEADSLWAAKGLVAALTPQTISEKDAEGLLRALVYDFLDRLILDEGEMSRRAHAEVLQKLDAAIHARTRDPDLVERYAVWKTGGHVQYHNNISFLTDLNFQSPLVLLTLGDHLVKDGTSVLSLTSLGETEKYTKITGVEPYQVFVLSRPASAGVGPSSMTLLLFEKAKAPSVLASVENGATGEGDRPQLFWQTCRHLIVSLEREAEASWRKRLSRWITQQWTEDKRC